MRLAPFSAPVPWQASHRALLRARAMAGIALLGERDVDRARRAEKRLVEINFEPERHVVAANRRVRVGRAVRAGAAEEILEAAKTAASAAPSEEVAEHGEDVVHAHAAGAIAAARAALERLVPELVIALALLGVVQDVVCLGRFLELLLGRLVAGVAVGVVLHRELAVGGLYLVRRRSLRDSKHLVIITLLCHSQPLSYANDLRGPQDLVLQHPALLRFDGDLSFRDIGRRKRRYRLHLLGVKLLADGIERFGAVIL